MEKKNVRISLGLIIIFTIIVVCAVFFIFKGKDNNLSGKISIMQRNWGAGDDSKGNGTIYSKTFDTITMEPKIGDKYDFKLFYNEYLTIQVTKANEEEITIQTNINMAQSKPSKGQSIFSGEKEFNVKRGETIEITTATLDAGSVFEIKYEK